MNSKPTARAGRGRRWLARLVRRTVEVVCVELKVTRPRKGAIKRVQTVRQHVAVKTINEAKLAKACQQHLPGLVLRRVVLIAGDEYE